jgi:cyclophilin family peptidyl-prolyl cis-trans isomerase
MKRFFFLPLALAFLVAACGGGGGPGPVPTVASVSAGTVKYSQSLVITVTGTDVNQGLNVSSPACTGMSLSNTAPFASSATTAYYRCRASALGASTVTVARASDSVTLGSAPFTVPAPQVTMTLNAGAALLGSIVFTLAPDRTPITVDNFLNYVNAGFYDGTIFHRIAPNPAVVQGGGYPPITPPVVPAPKGGVNPPIALEVGKGLGNVQWSVAMARTDMPNSATTQFFINLQNNPSLDTANGGYAVFGAVTTGTNVVSAIAAAPCTPIAGFSECVPTPNILITTAAQTQ